MKKKFLSLALVATMVVSSVVPTMAEGTAKYAEVAYTEIADYDFTGSKVPEGVTLVDLATATEDGVKLANGSISLPSTLFSEFPEDARSLVVEITVTKHNSDWPDSQWSERFFNFTSDTNVEDGVQTEGANGLGLSYNGNLNTTAVPYGADSTYMDSALTGANAIAIDEEVTVKMELNFATDVADLYLNGNLVNSDDCENDTITASDVKKFTLNSIGRSYDMWSMWGFMTVKNFKVSYSQAELTTFGAQTNEAGDKLAFISTVSKELIDGGKVAELGVLLSKGEITDGITMETADKVCKTDYVTTSSSVGANDANYAFRTIINGPETEDVYTAVTYMVLTDGTTVYGDACARSIADVQ